jgi:hypothetical protein
VRRKLRREEEFAGPTIAFDRSGGDPSGRQAAHPAPGPPRFVLNDASTAHARPESPGPGASGTSSWSPPRRSSAPSPCRSPRRTSANAAHGGLAPPPRTTPEGQQASISSTAPPINDDSYTTPPSAFVTHGCRTKPSERRRSALAEEVHPRAAVRDELATDRPLATDEMAVFGPALDMERDLSRPHGGRPVGRRARVAAAALPGQSRTARLVDLVWSA